MNSVEIIIKSWPCSDLHMMSLCLTFLYPAVCVSLSPSPILSLPLFPLTATALLSVSVSLFLFCWFVYFMSHQWKHAARVFRWLTYLGTWARGRTLRRGLVEALLLEFKGEEGKHKACEGLAPSRGKAQVTRGWKGRRPSAASRRALWGRGWGSRLRQRPALRVLCVVTKADL